MNLSLKNHIDSIIDKGSSEAWRFTGFYGKPDTQKRKESWDLLCLLNRRFDLPWLYAEDFNEIVSGLEKLGGSSRSQVQMQLFREAIDECGFLDLGLSGSQFTWQKHFSNGHSIWERLDRCLANNDWLIKFAGSKVHHLHCSTSDHNPLWIVLDGIETTSLNLFVWKRCGYQIEVMMKLLKLFGLTFMWILEFELSTRLISVEKLLLHGAEIVFVV